MIAIHTKFIGPSNTRAARIKAYILGDKTRKTVTIGYHDEAGDLPTSTDAKYRMAATMLADSYGWLNEDKSVHRTKGADKIQCAIGCAEEIGSGRIVPDRYELLSGANGDGSYVFIFSPLATVQTADKMADGVWNMMNGAYSTDHFNAALEKTKAAYTEYTQAKLNNEWIGRR